MKSYVSLTLLTVLLTTISIAVSVDEEPAKSDGGFLNIAMPLMKLLGVGLPGKPKGNGSTTAKPENGGGFLGAAGPILKMLTGGGGSPGTDAKDGGIIGAVMPFLKMFGKSDVVGPGGSTNKTTVPAQNGNPSPGRNQSANKKTGNPISGILDMFGWVPGVLKLIGGFSTDNGGNQTGDKSTGGGLSGILDMVGGVPGIVKLIGDISPSHSGNQTGDKSTNDGLSGILDIVGGFPGVLKLIGDISPSHSGNQTGDKSTNDGLSGILDIVGGVPGVLKLIGDISPSNGGNQTGDKSTGGGLSGILEMFGGVPGVLKLIGGISPSNRGNQTGDKSTGGGLSGILDMVGGVPGILKLIGGISPSNRGNQTGDKSTGGGLSGILDMVGGVPGILKLIGGISPSNRGNQTGDKSTGGGLSGILDMVGGVPGILKLIGGILSSNYGNQTGSKTSVNGTGVGKGSTGGLQNILGLLTGGAGSNGGISNILKTLSGGGGGGGLDITAILDLVGGGKGATAGITTIMDLLGGSSGLSKLISGGSFLNTGAIFETLVSGGGIASMLNDLLGGAVGNFNVVKLLFSKNMAVVREILQVLYDHSVLLPDELDRVCEEDMRYALDKLLDVFAGKSSDFTEDWSVKMADSIGKPVAGITTGNLYWLGNFRQCIGITAQRRESHRSYGDPTEFIGEYCLSEVSIKNFVFDAKFPFPVNVKWGMCFPSTCSLKNKHDMMLHWAKIAQGYLEVRMDSDFCQTKIDEPLSGMAVFVILLMSTLATIVVFGTLSDLWWQRKQQLEDGVTIGKCMTTLMAFSAVKSMNRIFVIREDRSELSAMHGLRTISMFWVIFCHMIMPMMRSYPWKNHRDILKVLQDRWIHPFLIGGPMVVETFFTISGFLVSYLFIKELAKRDGKINILSFYAYRLFRLIPSYSLVMLFMSGPFYYVGKSPIWPEMQKDVTACKDSWWKNLLFIQNLWDRDLECIPPSWYLAVDTQLYLIAPIFLYPLVKKPKLGMFLLFLGLLAGILIPMGLIITNDYETFGGLKTNFNKMSVYIMELYFKAWSHLSTFVIGLIAGYMVTVCQNQKIKFSKLVVVSGWLLTFAIFGVIFIGLSDYIKGEKIMDFPMQVAYGTVYKVGWSFGVAYIISACACGYGGIVNWFLSLKIFFAISRLTFAMYLTHYFAVSYYYAVQNDGLYFSYNQIIYSTVSTIALSFVLSVTLALLVEMPMMELGKIANESMQRKKKDATEVAEPFRDRTETDSETESAQFTQDRKPLIKNFQQ